MPKVWNKDEFLGFIKSIETSNPNNKTIDILKSEIFGGYYITSMSVDDWYYVSDFEEYGCKVESRNFPNYVRFVKYKTIVEKYMQSIIDKSNAVIYGTKYGISVPEKKAKPVNIFTRIWQKILYLKEKRHDKNH